MIKRAHIHQFLAVVETGSFTQAAQRIRVTQPTLSLGIAELERHTGAPLFVRDRRHARLTDAGTRFLPIARDLQKGFRAADAFSQTTHDDWPQLRLGLIPTVASKVLQPILATLAQTFTIEAVEGTDSELRSAMASGRIDMALGLLREHEQGNGVVPLQSERYVMMIPADHSLAGHNSLEPGDLSSEVMIARRSCEVLDETSRIFTRFGIRPRFALRSHSDERCLMMVTAGVGITTAPESFARPGIAAVPVTGYDLHRTLGLRIDPTWLASIDRQLWQECLQPIQRQISTHPPGRVALVTR